MVRTPGVCLLSSITACKAMTKPFQNLSWLRPHGHILFLIHSWSHTNCWWGVVQNDNYHTRQWSWSFANQVLLRSQRFLWSPDGQYFLQCSSSVIVHNSKDLDLHPVILKQGDCPYACFAMGDDLKSAVTTALLCSLIGCSSLCLLWPMYDTEQEAHGTW